MQLATEAALAHAASKGLHKELHPDMAARVVSAHPSGMGVDQVCPADVDERGTPMRDACDQHTSSTREVKPGQEDA